MPDRLRTWAALLSVSVALILPLDVRAQDPCAPENPNIVLFIADDLGWSDIPHFNPPIERDLASQLPTAGEEFQRPDLNRFAARALAALNGFSFSPQTGNLLSAVDKPALVPYASICSDASCQQAERDVLPGYGGLNRIAQGGLAFDRFYAAGAICSPSRATIFTGRHVGRSGQPAFGQHTTVNNSRTLPGHEITIAELLRQGCTGAPCFDPDGCGGKPCYDTALIGKWHLGRGPQSSPQAQGFDFFVGFLGSTRFYFSNRKFDCSLASSFDRVPNPWPACVAGKMPVPRTIKNRQEKCYADHAELEGEDICNFSERLYRNHALKFLRDRPQSGHPFFLVVSFHAAHASLTAPDRTADHYRTGRQEAPGVPLLPKRPSGRGQFWAVLEEMDAAIGQIVDALPPNTAILFVGDNGRPSSPYGAPKLKGRKRSLNEGGVRMGLLARAPRDVGCAAGPPSFMRAEGHVAGHVDLFPTIAELAGVSLPAPSAACGSAGPCLFANDVTGEPCTPGSTGCVKHVIMGKSFRGLLRVNAATPTPAPAREFAVSRYLDLEMLVTRSGAYGYKQCGVVPQNPLAAPVQAGSCTSCNGDQDCGGQICRSAGMLCVDKTTGYCSSSPSTFCLKDSQCGSGACVYDAEDVVGACGTQLGCPENAFCREVKFPCNRCIPAAWKLKRQNRHETALYELNTNPSEDQSLNCMKSKVPPSVVIDDLWSRLERELEYQFVP